MVSDDNYELFNTLMCFPQSVRQCMELIAHSYIRDSPVRVPHFMVACTISKIEGASQKDIREHLPFDKSYISTLVRELINMGYVVNDSEGKVQSLRLTQSGQQMCAVFDMMRDIIDANLFKDFTDEEKETFSTCMGKLNARVDRITRSFSEKEQ